MSRNKKYYFARLHVDYNKNYYGNDKENFIYSTLTEPSNIESSFTHHLVKTYWTFSNIGTLEWENGSKFFYGYLINFKAESTEEVFNENARQTQFELVENSIQAKAEFFLHIRTGIIAYCSTSKIRKEEFIKRFREIFQETHKNFFLK